MQEKLLIVDSQTNEVLGSVWKDVENVEETKEGKKTNILRPP